MKTTSFLTALIGAAYFVSAQTTGPVSITSPLPGTTWSIGSSETITWQNVQDGVSTLLVNLMKGDPNALTLVQTLASNIDASAGSTQVDVPQNVTEGNDYSLAIGTSPSQMAYIGGLIISSSNNNTSNATQDTAVSGTADATVSSTTDAAAAGTTDINLAERQVASEAASVTSVVAGAATSLASAATSLAGAATSGIPGTSAAASAGSAATSAVGSVGSAATSAAGSAGHAATSAAGSAGSAATSAATSDATRTMISGLLMAVPAALIAMTGF